MNSSILDRLDLDLEDIPAVSYGQMLRALLARLCQTKNGSRTSKSEKATKHSSPDVNAFIDEHWQALGRSATDFCNGTRAEASSLKDSLTAGYVVR